MILENVSNLLSSELYDTMKYLLEEIWIYTSFGFLFQHFFLAGVWEEIPEHPLDHSLSPSSCCSSLKLNYSILGMYVWQCEWVWGVERTHILSHHTQKLWLLQGKLGLINRGYFNPLYLSIMFHCRREWSWTPSLRSNNGQKQLGTLRPGLRFTSGCQMRPARPTGTECTGVEMWSFLTRPIWPCVSWVMEPKADRTIRSADSNIQFDFCNSILPMWPV